MNNNLNLDIFRNEIQIFCINKGGPKTNLSKIKYFAGHSLGEYSALVSSNSLKFEDGLKLVHLRGKFMQEAVPLGKGSMLAVMGLSIDELNHFLNKMDKKEGVCEIANDNSNSQIIFPNSYCQILTKFLMSNRNSYVF